MSIPTSTTKPVDIELLYLIGQYGFQTTALLQTLTKYSEHQLGRRLRALISEGLIARQGYTLEEHQTGRGGSRPNAYYLLKAGRSYLRAAGRDTTYLAPAKSSTIKHDVRMSEVHCTLDQLQTIRPEISLEQWWPDLRGLHPKFERNGEKTYITPDGAALFRKQQTQRFMYLLEYDRYTVDIKEIKQRMDNYFNYWKMAAGQPIPEWSNVIDFRVIFIMERRDHRRRDQYKNLLQYALTFNENKGSKLFWFVDSEHFDFTNPAKLLQPVFEVAIRGSHIKPRPIFII